MIAVDTARQLIDFGGRIGATAAEEQLRGAVAIHNILERHRVAYLADEVGMGKTYVALGALALFRHFQPTFRVLVIAPRENIQRKWVKELKNFVANNVRFADLRVKALHGTPAREIVICDNLLGLVHETALNPDRDFFARLSSFSLPLGKDPQSWRAKRDQLIRELPWLEREAFDLRQKDEFKDNYARAACCALPAFDLVILDEAHNLKHGLKSDSFRNRLLAFFFGHPKGRVSNSGFRDYRPRAKRVLFLSATPIENDYRQLWNQLEIFGFGHVAPELAADDATEIDKKASAQQFLIRRVTSMNVGGERLTKNLYRREWRSGGVAVHDDPLKVPDERERLIVALVQKKVAEVLGSERFNNSFQIGMLASFESFLETAKAKTARAGEDDEEATFDDAEQAKDVEERAGVDVGSVDRLARSYRRCFGAELPHPKMDAIVERLKESFDTGRKALVFVRRIASVKELQRKLELRYDEHLFAHLRRDLPESLIPKLERIVADYKQAQLRSRRRQLESQQLAPDVGEDEVERTSPESEDAGGTETFFAWFFRGEGPPDVLSGALMQRRFSQAGSVHSTFFEDNHIAWLLDVGPGGVLPALAGALGTDADSLRQELRARAALWLPQVKKQQRRNLFLAFQQAALSILVESPGPLQASAQTIWQERYFETAVNRAARAEAPDPDDWLETSTFWTALRDRQQLRQSLWPAPTRGDFRARFREQELRREIFSAMTRLGSPFIDLYALALRRIGSFELRAREEETDADLAGEFLELLETQAAAANTGLDSFAELAAAAENFDLILDVNIPDVRTRPLAEAATEFGRLLRQQQPVGGMFGSINQTLVRQFRMPGYPMVLISTDLLQEGEDLHTFCSSVYHYGISWMPSSMEQRIGRIDRVSSESERRLTRLAQPADGDEMLQVYYPHLRDTVEVLQVQRVLERMNLFLKLMHEQLGEPEGDRHHIDVSSEILRTRRAVEHIRQPLQTAFPVRDEYLQGEPRPLAVSPDLATNLSSRFRRLRAKPLDGLVIDWDDRAPERCLIGSLRLEGQRQQSFRLELRSIEGRPMVHCLSVIGQLPADARPEDVAAMIHNRPVQIVALPDARHNTQDLAVDGEVLLAGEEFDAERVGSLIRRVAMHADAIEEKVLGADSPLTEFWERMTTEQADAN